MSGKIYNKIKNGNWLMISIASISFFTLLLTIWLLAGSHFSAASSETETQFALGPEINVLQSLNKAYVELAKMVVPAVVNISTKSVEKAPRVESRQRRDPSWDPFDFFNNDDFFNFFDQLPRRGQVVKSLGSGFIVDKEGYILTNNHVVSGADEIKVTLNDKREFNAKLIGADPETDVAVIKIDKDDLPIAKLGNSDKIQVGEIVLAIGSPFGLKNTVTNGIVSATGRSSMGITDYDDFIQTNADINRGNSGGPLINIRGEVIGINTAIATEGGGNVGVGFSIPVNMARNVMDQLIKNKKIVRGWLGMSLQEVNKDIAEKYGLDEPKGALISAVDGPAKEAGLKQGDLVIKFNDETVSDGAHLKSMVAAAKPGDKVKVTVIRDGKDKEFTVKLGERTEKAKARLSGYAEIPGDSVEEWLGVTVQELDDTRAQRLGYEGQSGVLVAGVNPDGPAAKVDDPPERGDLIQEIERNEIKSMDDYKEAMEKCKDMKKIMIRLRRATNQGQLTWYILVKNEK